MAVTSTNTEHGSLLVGDASGHQMVGYVFASTF